MCYKQIAVSVLFTAPPGGDGDRLSGKCDLQSTRSLAVDDRTQRPALYTVRSSNEREAPLRGSRLHWLIFLIYLLVNVYFSNWIQTVKYLLFVYLY